MTPARDIFDKEKRSKVMSLIRSQGTKFEARGFEILRRAGLSYRKHPKGILGKPDAANKSRKIAIFFDSDFWHGYDYERTLKAKLRNAFWQQKIEYNIKRGKEVTRELRKQGWTVIRFWGHDILKNPEKCMRVIRRVDVKRIKKDAHEPD